MKKEDIALAKDIAQSDYNKSVEELLLKQITAIEKFQKVLTKNSIQSIYNHYSPSKKKLITPLEQPVYLGNEIRYPDFTILNVNTRKEVYFEHFGSVDDPDYCNSRLETIEKYQLNGLQLGVNFFCTFETLDKPINMQVFENMLYSFNLVPNKKEL